MNSYLRLWNLSPPKTNSLHLKIDRKVSTFLLGFGLFSGDMLVLGIFREGKLTSRIR